MASLNNAQDDNLDNEQPKGSFTPPIPSSPSNSDDLFNQAKSLLAQGSSNAVTSDQLQQLAQHEGTNNMLNMFMQMVGAAGRVNATPYQNVINQSSQQQAQRLALQNQMAQQSTQRAQVAQGLGAGQQEAQLRQLQLENEQKPLSNLQRATILAFDKQAHNGKQTVNPSDLDNMSQLDYKNYIQGGEQAGQLGVEQQRNAAMAQMYGGRNIQVVKDPVTGKEVLINKLTGETNAVNNNNTNLPQSNNVVSTNDTSQSLNYAQLNNQAPKVATQIDKLQKEYQKQWGDKDLGFQQTINTLNSTLDEAKKGNYVAAGSLPAQEAKMFEGLQGRLTNYDIQMMNDPKNKGILNTLQGTISGALGQGKLTPQDSANIELLVKQLENSHQQNIQTVQNQYLNRANSITNTVGKSFKDDNYLFGKEKTQSQDTSTQSKGGMPDNHISFDDYLKQASQSGNK